MNKSERFSAFLLRLGLCHCLSFAFFVFAVHLGMRVCFFDIYCFSEVPSHFSLGLVLESGCCWREQTPPAWRQGLSCVIAAQLGTSNALQAPRPARVCMWKPLEKGWLPWDQPTPSQAAQSFFGSGACWLPMGLCSLPLGTWWGVARAEGQP